MANLNNNGQVLSNHFVIFIIILVMIHSGLYSSGKSQILRKACVIQTMCENMQGRQELDENTVDKTVQDLVNVVADVESNQETDVSKLNKLLY